jgi:hypothetical protein
VIGPGVDHQVLALRHVAADAGGPGAAGGMMVMLGRRIAHGWMALRPDLIAFGFELQAVGVMAVGAGDAGGVHPALQEGAVEVVA